MKESTRNEVFRAARRSHHLSRMSHRTMLIPKYKVTEYDEHGNAVKARYLGHVVVGNRGVYHSTPMGFDKLMASATIDLTKASTEALEAWAKVAEYTL